MAGRIATTLQQRFGERCVPVPESGCWLWIGKWNRGGYGCISVGKRELRAHRVSYEMRCGSIPDGAVICHKCDTPACVNPDHLFLGTQADNVRDAFSKGRHRTSSRYSKPRTNLRRRKLTRESVVHIRASSESFKAMALRFGVDPNTVRSVKRGLSYQEIEQ